MCTWRRGRRKKCQTERGSESERDSYEEEHEKEEIETEQTAISLAQKHKVAGVDFYPK